MPAGPSFFPRTKLLFPQLRPDFIPRPRLNRLIQNQVASRRITLINAPAGYGKTTAAIAWAEVNRDFNLLWITLDAQDDNPLQFLRLMIAALQQLNPNCGSGLIPTLAGQTSASLKPERAFGLLVNEILDCNHDPFVIILDDLHILTDTALFAGLDYFIANQPPQLHLLATARHEPPLALPLLRSRDQLGEILAPDLRFTRQEAVTLLEDGLKLELSEDDLHSFYDDTEGWVAGLRLLGGLGGEKVIGSTMSPDSDVVKRNVFDLFVAEVLDQQGDDIRNFLLETSVLRELTPELCAMVTKNPDSRLLLEEVYRRNLFLSSVYDEDTGEAYYRYHELFAEFLAGQLRRDRPGDVKSLHKQAGLNHTNADRAVHHLLLAEEYIFAAKRIADEAPRMFNSGLYRQLQRWIEALPPSTQDAFPWLVYYLGACQWVAYDHTSAVPTLEKAMTLFEAQDDQRGQGETMVILSTIIGTFGDIDNAFRLSQAADHFPLSAVSRTQLLLNRAWLEMEKPHKDLTADFEAALDLVENSQDQGAFHIATHSLREFFCALPEGRRAARHMCKLIESRESLDQPGIPQLSFYGLTATLQYLYGNFEEALKAAVKFYDINQRLGEVPGLQMLTILMPLILRLQERWLAVDEYLARLEELIHLVPGWQAGLLLPSGLIFWERGERDEAARTLGRMETQSGEHIAVGEFSRQTLGGLIALNEGRGRSGIGLLQKAVDLQLACRFLHYFGDMRLALAYAYLQTGEKDIALSVMRPALNDWSDQNLPGMILTTGQVIASPVLELAIQHQVHTEFARHTLDQLHQLNKPQPIKVSSTGETLTVREVEVLRLLAAGFSNQDIADELVVSLPTVKTHVSRVLTKLDATSRGQAVARARELRLL